MASMSEASPAPSSSVVVRKRESSFDEPPEEAQGSISWQDGQSEITLQGDDRVALQAFFYFCYDLPYEDAAAEGGLTAMFYVKIYAVAGKYECEGLMKTVARKLIDAAGSLWSDKDFVSALAVGYQLPSTSKGESLREGFESTIGANLPYLLGCSSFRAALTHVDDLAINLLFQNVAASGPVTPAAITQYQVSRPEQKNRGLTIDQSRRTRNFDHVIGGVVEHIRLKCDKCDVLITDAFWIRNRRAQPGRGGKGELFLMNCPVCTHCISSSTGFLRTDERITVLM
ncbi:hypothetical protein MBLNU457_g0542t3 [Dothideomycetes sp. NU457]